MAVSDLTEAERAHYEEYTNLRGISDWDGFTATQEQRKDDSRAWLENQRKEIWRAAQPKSDGGDGKGWGVNNRQARYDTLSAENLNTASPTHEYTLPAGGNTPTEKSLIEEREVWIVVSSTTDEQKARKQACTNELISRRKQVYSLGEKQGWSRHNRRARYKNLCIATDHGKIADAYQKTHNKYGKELPPPKPKQPKPSGGSSRGRAVERARSYIGTSEKPLGSNRGDPQPSGWQRRVIGGHGFAWCACFTTCMAWDAGVKGGSSAGVAVIVDMARRGRGMFRGWTTDPGRVQRGDFAVIQCTSCHIELVADSENPWSCIGGNVGAGRVETRNRRGQVIEWALVDYP